VSKLSVPNDCSTAAEAVFRTRPDVLSAFLAAMSAIFMESCSLAWSPSPYFADLYA
jgi:hypothetical protein